MTRTRHHSRLAIALRKTAKWGGAAVAVILIAVWVWSAWWDFDWSAPGRWCVKVEHGRLLVAPLVREPPTPWPGEFFFYASDRIGLDWSFEFKSSKYGLWIQVPLWAVTLPTLALTIFAWHRDAAIRRRIGAGLCTCGYDRAGLPSGAACPECGSAPDAHP